VGEGCLVCIGWWYARYYASCVFVVFGDASALLFVQSSESLVHVVLIVMICA
jgi:hypothetical protein